jgi:hypothetical protein
VSEKHECKSRWSHCFAPLAAYLLAPCRARTAQDGLLGEPGCGFVAGGGRGSDARQRGEGTGRFALARVAGRSVGLAGIHGGAQQGADGAAVVSRYAPSGMWCVGVHPQASRPPQLIWMLNVVRLHEARVGVLAECRRISPCAQPTSFTRARAPSGRVHPRLRFHHPPPPPPRRLHPRRQPTIAPTADIQPTRRRRAPFGHRSASPRHARGRYQAGTTRYGLAVTHKLDCTYTGCAYHLQTAGRVSVLQLEFHCAKHLRPPPLPPTVAGAHAHGVHGTAERRATRDSILEQHKQALPCWWRSCIRP